MVQKKQSLRNYEKPEAKRIALKKASNPLMRCGGGSWCNEARR